ncbi:uncharacterized protein LOC126267695 [Schistocerca gregaria]|uniref:uncharacterized protein LOC126267695 n=1 Tax=Schistocerca gregaria TaxID=7010 RepID=UPI00211E3E7B|nr:uncharacterized protein LOC126267695 [Schistocerca gregaria]
MVQTESWLPRIVADSDLGDILRVLHLAGTLRPPGTGGAAFWTANVATFAAGAIFFASQASAMAKIGTSDFDSFVLLLCTMNTAGVYVLRLIHFHAHSRVIHQLAYQVRDELYQWATGESDAALVAESSRRMRSFTRLCARAALVASLCWLCVPPLLHGASPKGLPFILELPFGVEGRPWTFLAAWIYCALGTFHVAVVSVIADTLNNRGSLGDILKYVAYMSVMVTELGVYCWFGNELITESEAVAESACYCAHRARPTALRRGLLLVAVRAARPLTISAGPLYVFCREAFVSIANASYSFCAILRNFKDE